MVRSLSWILTSYSCKLWISCVSGAVAKSSKFGSFLAVSRVVSIWFFVVCVCLDCEYYMSCLNCETSLTTYLHFFTLLGPNKLISSVEHPLFSSDCKIKFCTHVWNALDTAYVNEQRNAQVELLSNYTQHSALVLLICQLGKKFSIFYGTWSYYYT
jgi:hypothetical protein